MPKLSPQAFRTAVGTGLLIQVASLIVMIQVWKHHHNYLYALPAFFVGFLLATCSILFLDRSLPK
jgi:hypothetical protein